MIKNNQNIDIITITMWFQGDNSPITVIPGGSMWFPWA